MISSSTLSCYSALSSRILTTNHLITFLTLHSRYPVLQPINTYYSLIGAIYVLFCPRITSPLLYRYYPHLLSISRNCLAPPQFPESLHRTFIPQCIYSPHCAVSPCKIFAFCMLSVCFLYAFCMLSVCFLYAYCLLSVCLLFAFCLLSVYSLFKSSFVYILNTSV